MKIRHTKPEDLLTVMKIYDHARNFMQEHDNESQWINGYPSVELISGDIKNKYSYVCEEGGEIIGTFCFIEGIDPTYLNIYDGSWLNDEPYGTIHRLASAGERKGVAEGCFRWCLERCKNIRVDTHRDNLVMQNVLKKNGFVYCGIIYITNGSERLAFQKKDKNICTIKK